MESVDTAIEAKATQWLVELKTGTEAELELLWPEFYAWMNADPEHRRVYLQLEASWQMDRKQMILAKCLERATPGQSVARVEEVEATAVPSRTRARERFIGGTVTASVMVACLAAFVWFHSWDRYATGYGERRPIALPDGSQIELNTNTRLRVRMTEHEREIALDQGEALFNVAADKARPFTVRVDNDVLVARGTEFAVRLEPSGVTDAYVQKGIVEVSTRKEPSGEGGLLHSLYLKEGDTVSMGDGSTRVLQVGSSGIQQRLAWRAGNIDVDGPLADAVNEFNRYNTRQLKVEDPATADIHVQGVFKATDPDEFARELQQHFGVRVSFPTDDKEGVIKLGGNS